MTTTELKTHDGRPVHPVDAALPEGANGWTMCLLQGGAYSTWIEKADQPRAHADYYQIEAELKKIRTHAAMDAFIKAHGFENLYGETLADLRVSLHCRLIAIKWPLRLFK